MSETTTTAAMGALPRLLWGIGGGTLVAIGTVGAFLPGLPTTIFLILACWCFSRSHPAAAEWVKTRPLFSPYFERLEAEGFSLRVRKAALAAMWTASLTSGVILYAAGLHKCGIGTVLFAGIGTIVILGWPYDEE